MPSILNDIEEFTLDQLRAEILRRETADREGRCWYCNRNLAAHTCKHAKESILPGWEVQPPRFVRTEDCMANAIEYWQVDAKNTATGRHAIGSGATAKEATDACVANVMSRYREKSKGKIATESHS